MNSNRLWIALLALGFLGLLVLVGYFWSQGSGYGEIEGLVTRGGVPLEHVEVVFFPEDDGPRLWALTDRDGHFEAMTDAIQKVPARKGAPVGKYHVTLVDRHDRILLAEQTVARDVSRRAGSLDPNRFGVVAQTLEKKKNASGSGLRVPAQYNQRLDTPFNDIEIKPGKNWFDLDVK
jgi:hypothetical protein